MPNELKKVHVLGGVNLQTDPRALKEGEAVLTKNLVPLLSGQMGKRKTLALVGTIIPDLDADDVPVGIYTFDMRMSPQSYFGLVIYTRAGVLYAAVFGAVHPTFDAVYTERQLSEGEWDGVQPVVFVDGEAIFILPGTSGTSHTVPAATMRSRWGLGYEVGAVFFTGNGSQGTYLFPHRGWQDLNWYTLTGANPAGGAPYRQRTVYWDLGESYHDCILFSDNLNGAVVGADVLASNGRYIRVGSATRGKIVSCISVMLTSVGTPASTGLLVISQTGCHLVTGEPNQSTDTTDMLGDLQIQDMNVRCSCVGHATVVTTPYGVLWLGEDDVWLFDAGQLPRRVGTKLRPRIVGQPRSSIPKLYASYHDGFYRLALYSPGSAGGKGVAPDEQWLLDLRDGPPQGSADARWFGPMGYLPPYEVDVDPVPGLFCCRQDSVGGTKTRLVAAHPVWGGSRVQLQLLDVEGGTGEDLSATNTLIPVHQRANNCPTFELVTRDDDFGDFNTEKLYTGTEVSLLPTIPTAVTVEAIMGGGDATGEAAAESTLIAGGFILDVDDLDDRTLAETYDHQLSYPDESTRPMGKSVQLRVYDNTGYVITEFNDEFYFEWDDDAAAEPHTAILTRGHYANLKLLLDELVRAMGVAVDGLDVFNHDVTAQTGRASTITLSSDNGFDWWIQNQNFSIQNPKTKSLMAMLGFDPEQDLLGTGPTWESQDPVHWNPAAGMNVAELVLRAETFPRRRLS